MRVGAEPPRAYRDPDFPWTSVAGGFLVFKPPLSVVPRPPFPRKLCRRCCFWMLPLLLLLLLLQLQRLLPPLLPLPLLFLLLTQIISFVARKNQASSRSEGKLEASAHHARSRVVDLVLNAGATIKRPQSTRRSAVSTIYAFVLLWRGDQHAVISTGIRTKKCCVCCSHCLFQC